MTVTEIARPTGLPGYSETAPCDPKPVGALLPGSEVA